MLPEGIFNLLLQGTGKHLWRFFLFVLLLLVGLFAFEYMTAHFRLAKIQKSAEIVAGLNFVAADEKTAQLQAKLRLEVDKALTAPALGATVAKGFQWKKVWPGVGFWLIPFAIPTALMWFQPEKRTFKIFVIALAIVSLAVFIAACLPAFLFPLSHMFIYPFSFAGVLLFAWKIYDFIIWDRYLKKQKQKA